MTQATDRKAGPTTRRLGRGRIYEDITATIGDTPIVRLKRLAAEKRIKANLLVKLEFFNPIASVKDRIGVNMIDALEASGKLKPGGTLVEPTSGNTGIAPGFRRRRPAATADPGRCRRRCRWSGARCSPSSAPSWC